MTAKVTPRIVAFGYGENSISNKNQVFFQILFHSLEKLIILKKTKIFAKKEMIAENTFCELVGKTSSGGRRIQKIRADS